MSLVNLIASHKSASNLFALSKTEWLFQNQAIDKEDLCRIKEKILS